MEEGEIKVRLLPLDLDLNRSRPSERGLPACAKPDLAREIAEDLAVMSEAYGTEVRYNEADGLIDVLPA
jgi:poly-gamma-glutamate synthesis protein (capsule biosynthesis protein)